MLDWFEHATPESFRKSIESAHEISSDILLKPVCQSSFMCLIAKARLKWTKKIGDRASVFWGKQFRYIQYDNMMKLFFGTTKTPIHPPPRERREREGVKKWYVGNSTDGKKTRTGICRTKPNDTWERESQSATFCMANGYMGFVCVYFHNAIINV